MTSVTSDILSGIGGDLAFKAPVKAATVTNITLSGEQTVDNVALVTGNRVLVKDQNTTTENGIYVVDTGAWTRAKDFDGSRDVVTGTAVLVLGGFINADTLWRVSTSGNPTPGSAMQFSEFPPGPAGPAATGLSGTSSTSVAIATGSKSFTTQSGLLFDVGVWLLIASDANEANYMHGQVTAYSGTSLTVNVTNIGGSGTYADWKITVSGTQGAIGNTGPAGPTGTIDDLTGVPTATVTPSDYLVFQDVDDGNDTKRTAVSGLLALATVSGVFKGFQVLTAASGTYTPTTGATNGIAIAIGGGGGGGGSDMSAGGSEGAAGGGGGGGCAIARFAISGDVSYTVGTAGAASNTTGGNGGDGGTTTLTGIVVATGGTGGQGTGTGAADETAKLGGTGGVGTTGALLLGGSDGGNGLTAGDSVNAGNGGSAPFGGGGGRGGHGQNAGGAQTAPEAGNNYGGGGGGAAENAGTGTAGAAGAQGVIYIFEFQ